VTETAASSRGNGSFGRAASSRERATPNRERIHHAGVQRPGGVRQTDIVVNVGQSVEFNGLCLSIKLGKIKIKVYSYYDLKT